MNINNPYFKDISGALGESIRRSDVEIKVGLKTSFYKTKRSAGKSTKAHQMRHPNVA